MKRILMTLLVVVIAMSANAQKGFVCTGNNVNLRKGPGNNYKVVVSDYTGERFILVKGAVLKDLGQKKNGFCKVSTFIHQQGEYYGWVSAKYLKPVRLCSNCEGLGYVNNVFDTCTKCNGRGY